MITNCIDKLDFLGKQIENLGRLQLYFWREERKKENKMAQFSMSFYM